jgi:hypothetical protein
MSSKAHQRMEKDKEKVGFGKVESLDEIEYELINKGGKGTSLWWSHQAS